MDDFFSGHKGLIFNIERYAVHDGPGIRTIVFLQGCPLKCSWCQNPEGQELTPQIAFFKEKCTLCRKCIEVCRKNAIKELHNNIVINSSECLGCGTCIGSCSNDALNLLTRFLSAKEVLEMVMQDEVFYRRSGGGITLSGGEPFMQLKFSLEILRLAKERGLDTCIETCGYFNFKNKNSAKMIELVDTFYYDLKNMDSQRHKEETGIENSKILKNFVTLCELGKKVIVRIPVIPNFNDSMRNIHATAEFIRNTNRGNIIRVELLPYHELGVKKYQRLGKEYFLKEIKPPTNIKMLEIKEVFNQYELNCHIL